jgi:putative DNA primase/helicase
VTKKRKPNLEGASHPNWTPEMLEETRRLKAEEEASMSETELRARRDAERKRLDKEHHPRQKKNAGGAAGNDTGAEKPASPVSDDPRTAEEVRRFTEGQQQRIAADAERHPVLPSLRANPSGAAQAVIEQFFSADREIKPVPVLTYWRENWYRYVSEHWAESSEEDMKHFLHDKLQLCRQLDSEGEVIDFVTSRQNVSELYFQVQNLVTIPSNMVVPCGRTPDGSWTEVDGRGWMVCRGEAVNLLTGARRNLLYNFIPNGADWRYDPKALDCPLWTEFLYQLFGDKDDEVAMLQEWFGYVLSGDTWAQKGLIIVGPPRAGKGVIGHVLTNLLGKSMVSSPALHAIGGRFGLESLIDKRMCLISDARLSNRQDIFAVIETLLRVIGGDKMSVDRKNKSALNLELGVRVLMLSNEMPYLPDNSTAINNRFLIIKLRESFLGREDVHLLDKLLLELPAIANWAIAGYRRLVESYKFTEPKSSRDERDEWRFETNPLEEFVKGYCEVRPGLVTLPAGFAEKYNIWREKNGTPSPVASNSLSKALKAMLGDGFESGWVGSKRLWKGIKLNARGKKLKRPPPAF